MAKQIAYSECHSKTIDMFKGGNFFSKIGSKDFSVGLGPVLSANGPDRAHHTVLLKLRAAITEAKRSSNKSEGEILVAACKQDDGKKRRYFLLSNNLKRLSERVAAVKMLRHLYMIRSVGGQDLWLYSPPKAYKKWIYDEYKWFLNSNGLTAWASKDKEVYSDSDKKALADAAQKARSWAANCVAKLATPDQATKDLIAYWFCDAGAGDAEIETARAKLHGGFVKINNVLNSNRLVFSDDPLDRAKGGWKDFAFVYQWEKINVIYIQGATIECATGTKMWKAALTIIHELSHREMGTDDHRYDDDGKLAPSAGLLTAAQAIDNADNWGYFATAVNNELRDGVRDAVAV